MLEIFKKLLNMLGLLKMKETHGNSGVVGAAMTASIMVALADNRISPEERDRLIELISIYRPDLSPREVLAMIEKHVSMVKNAPSEFWPETMATISRNLSEEHKKLVLHGAGNIALVDGKYSLKEQEKINEIAKWIGISESEFKIWKKEFQETIDEAEKSGMSIDIE